MADIDDVLARLSDDPSFVEQVRSDPGEALRDLSLSNDDLMRVEEALGGQQRTGPALRQVYRARPGRSRLAYLIAGSAVLGAVVGARAALPVSQPSPTATSPRRLPRSRCGRARMRTARPPERSTVATAYC